MKPLVHALVIVMHATVNDEPNQSLSKLTSDFKYVVSFPPLSIIGADIDNLQDYQPDSGWMVTDKNPVKTKELVTAAIEVLDASFVQGDASMQVATDDTL